jgi:hypothetical protein
VFDVDDETATELYSARLADANSLFFTARHPRDALTTRRRDT